MRLAPSLVKCLKYSFSTSSFVDLKSSGISNFGNKTSLCKSKFSIFSTNCDILEIDSGISLKSLTMSLGDLK